MLFSFEKTVEELRKDKEFQKDIFLYEKIYGKINKHIEDQVWYKEYLSYLPNYNDIIISNKLFAFGDKNVFLKLLTGALPLKPKLIIKNKELYMLINTKDSIDDKMTVSQLPKQQLVGFYRILCLDQIVSQVHSLKEDSIHKERKKNIEHWQKQIQSIPAKKHIASTEQEILKYLNSSQ